MLAILISISIFVSQSSVQVNAAAKPGTNCNILGQTTILFGKKFTCIKLGNKKVWDKGSIFQAAKFAEDLLESERNFCNIDLGTPTEWLKVQSDTDKVRRCLPPFRYLPGKPLNYLPKATITDKKELLNVEDCKIKDISGLTSKFTLANFGKAPFQSSLFTPAKNAKVLVVGVQFTDVITNNTPEQDYKLYTDFYSNFLKTSSDLDLNINYKFMPNYIKVEKTLKSYNLGDEHADTSDFKKDFLTVTDPLIDYSDIGQVLIVMPAQTRPELLSAHMNWNTEWRTNEGLIPSVYLHGPILPTVPQIDRIWSVSPWITIHEAIGHQIGLDDHYGDQEVFSQIKTSSDFKDYGAPSNQMSGAYGDFLAWDKWLGGLISDDQIRCAPKDKTTYHWIRPSSTQGNYIKAVVVPLNDGMALEIESFRSTGWNWKFPTFYSGARVHLIDRSETRHGYGVYLLRSENKVGTRDGSKGIKLKNNLFDAALQLNESLTANGLKITVIESGYFGDIIKIEKIS